MSSLRRSLSSGSIPFLWEHRPGVAKVSAASDAEPRKERSAASKPRLPPPPGPVGSDNLVAAINRSGRWTKKVEDDPFLAAYMECTDGGKKGDGEKRKGKKVFGRSVLFCRFGCGEVREDGMVVMALEKRKKPLQRVEMQISEIILPFKGKDGKGN
ncbi:hypothetical protein HPP92_026659 [Vanilla planifolia]|uniref:Uncharacterized protein n=1 Tax=Vanilla planifolia TaxID=51239 RepID=A0A835PC48_VANPL|nr:hypothetical protein HPP92_026659 [Vanilla planifolia]